MFPIITRSQMLLVINGSNAISLECMFPVANHFVLYVGAPLYLKATILVAKKIRLG